MYSPKYAHLIFIIEIYKTSIGLEQKRKVKTSIVLYRSSFYGNYFHVRMDPLMLKLSA